MILSPPSLKLSVLAVSLGVHVAVLLVWASSPAIEIEGGAGAVVEARLGNSFADLAQGTAEPPAPEERLPETLEAIAEAQPPEVAAQRVAPQALTLDLATVPVARADPVEVTSPEVPEVAIAQTVEPTETMTAVAEAPSVRPKTRPDKPAPPQRKKKTQQGNSNQNASAGTTTGSQAAKAVQQSSQTGQSAQAGNAAASNYSGAVMRKISRIPRPRSKTNGTTVVRFAIAPSGALQSVSIAQSSGSEDLDQAALRIVSRAAPFPAPPPGARRNFAIKISGRG